MTTFKTLENEIIPEGVKLPNTFLMIEDGQATLVEFTNGDCKFSSFSADLLAIVEGTFQVPQLKPASSYIATATEYGKWFEFKVLASNARSSEPAGRTTDFEQGRQAVEQKYENVTWVTPYRFMKEITAC